MNGSPPLPTIGVKPRIRSARGLLPVAWMAALWAASSTPGGGGPTAGPPLSPFAQNALHVPAYAALCAAWIWALESSPRRLPWAFALSVLYAGIDELHQATVPGRTASAADLLVDALSVGLAIATWHLLAARRATGRRPRS